MSKKHENVSGFLVQGSILAIASIISRILGLIYRVPLTAIIGKTGNDYYGTAFEIYNIILIISSYSLPLAVSKMVATRMAVGEVKNTRRVFRASLVFAFCSGLMAALIVFFGADFLAGDILKTPFAVPALKVLSPVLFIVAILGVYRGFFQGMGSMVPSAVSQILEQIMNCIVSIAAAFTLVSIGAKAGAILGDTNRYRAAYGAAGGTLGTAAGAFIALLFMLFVYSIYRRVFKKKLARDHSKHKESYLSLSGVLLLTIIPVLLSTTLYNMSGILDQGIFKNLALAQGLSAKEVSEYWGVFTGQYRVLTNVPIAIASAIAASCVPALAKSYSSGKKGLVKRQIKMAMRFIMIVSLPCMVGFMVLSSPMMELLFSDTVESSGWMLVLGAASVVFYSVSTLSNGILQGINHMSIPVRNAAISLVAQIGVLVLLMEFFRLHIYAVVLANTFYALLMCVLNGISVRRFTGVRFSVRRTIIVPLMCSMIMGGVVYVFYQLLNFLINNTVATIISIIIGMFIYLMLMVFLRGITERDLRRVPLGTKAVLLFKRMRLL